MALDLRSSLASGSLFSSVHQTVAGSYRRLSQENKSALAYTISFPSLVQAYRMQNEVHLLHDCFLSSAP
jgi:hypothetical protein